MNTLGHVNKNKTTTKSWSYGRARFYQKHDLWNYVYVVFIYDIKLSKVSVLSGRLFYYTKTKDFFSDRLKQVFSRVLSTAGSYFDTWQSNLYILSKEGCSFCHFEGVVAIPKQGVRHRSENFIKLNEIFKYKLKISIKTSIPYLILNIKYLI